MIRLNELKSASPSVNLVEYNLSRVFLVSLFAPTSVSSLASSSHLSFSQHFPDCSKHTHLVITLPKGHDQLFWTARAKTAPCPMVGYAYFKPALLPIAAEKAQHSTHAVSEHYA